jgi:4-hydroxy-3-polyprenylbenzoate decarboxylase
MRVLSENLNKICKGLPLVVVCDDPAFLAEHINNFLWVTFTRSDPAADIFGAHEKVVQKHWGCELPLVIDARIKPHHAPVMQIDSSVVEKANDLIQRTPALLKLCI